MIRLIGVLTGAALATGLLLLVLGVPRLGGQPVADNAPNAVPDLDARNQPALPRETAPGTPAMENPELSADTETRVETEALPVTETAVGMDTVAETEPATELAMTTPTGPGPEFDSSDTPTADAAPPDNWYAFWSPFRSRIAADGFVAELSRTTGLDYRVVKLKPGVYEVAVAYTDDADIEDKLTRISAATGLDMSGG